MLSERPVFKRILVALDNRDASHRAAEVAAGLAAVTGARVALLHVIDYSRVYDVEFGSARETLSNELRAATDDLLDRYQAAIPSGIRVDRLTRDGDPPVEIVAAADKWGADLIIVGSHGRGRLARLLMEGTAESVVRNAHCPVLSVSHAPPTTPANAAHDREEDLEQVA